MRPFYQTRMYYSDYSVRELTDILRTDSIEDGVFTYNITEETEDGFVLHPFMEHIGRRRSFAPVVKLRLQEEAGRVKVTIACRLTSSVAAFTCLWWVLLILVVIGCARSGSLTFLSGFFMANFIVAAIAFFVVGIFVSFAWCRKKFIQELKLTPIDKNPKGEN